MRVTFHPNAYPAAGDAPCGQAKAPDAGHAPYTGEIKRISATDADTVVFELCRPDVAFLSKIASPAFAINDAGWLASHIDPAVTGPQAIVDQVRTAPGRTGSESWTRGSEVSLARNDGYWGDKAANERFIARWYDNAGQRIAELQNASVDGVDDIDPTAVQAVVDDTDLKLAARPGLDVFYAGFTDTFAPFDNELVRRAIATGIDRQHIVDTDFPPGSELATSTRHAPSRTRAAATPGTSTTRHWPRRCWRPPGSRTASIRRSSTARRRPTTCPTRPAWRPSSRTSCSPTSGSEPSSRSCRTTPSSPTPRAGKLDGIHLLGQSVTYPDAGAFLEARFGSGAAPEFGTTSTDIGKALAAGRATISNGKRDAAYAKVNDAIRSDIPLIPIARSATNAAYRADVEGAATSPLGLERFAPMVPGDRRQLVWLTTAEPAGLYCADETDSVSALLCTQLSEGLYGYDPTSAAPVPVLAKGCDPDADLLVWTCTLRQGVRFHDGSALDAGDVVTSYAVQWDADHPLHRGDSGSFATLRIPVRRLPAPTGGARRLNGRLAGRAVEPRALGRGGASGGRWRGRRDRGRGNGRGVRGGRLRRAGVRAARRLDLLGRPVDILGEVAGDLMARVEEAQLRILGHAALRVARASRATSSGYGSGNRTAG